MSFSVHDPHVAAAIAAIRTGETEGLRRVLDEHPGLPSAPIERRGGTLTLLHVVADWPGYYPRGPEVARLLGDRGANPDATTSGEKPETPLHWAASSDDLEVAVALLELGASTEIDGGSIGTPLANAVGYGCWHVARLLVARGARVEHLWQAAALGLAPRVEELLDAAPPDPGELNHAFWQACHGGQRRMAELLLERGADIDATPWHSDRTPLEITVAIDTRRETMSEWLRGRGAADGEAPQHA